jgi:hypothetical protein
MSSPFRKLCPRWIVLCVVFDFFSYAAAQGPMAVSPSAPTLKRLVQQSGLIFAGSVLKVEHSSPNRAGEVATVRLTFRVEQAIRGVRTGQILEAREWAGLWESAERYRAGERIVLLLYPRSKLGLTSPVGGALGHFNVNSRDEVLLQTTQLRGLSPSVRSVSAGHGISRISARDLLRVIKQDAAE